MVNFEYYSPTRLVFGKGVVDQLPAKLEGYGKKVLLAYGGGSIKRSGLYDKVVALLKGYEVTELAGIEPNPKYTTSVLDGVRLCKERGIDFILAVGGGSVLDCCKAIAAGAKYDGEPWDLISRKAPVTAALPIFDVITMAATGSEYDGGGVISYTERNDKRAIMSPLLNPVCSFIDPEYTYTVPARQTIAGVADAISHIIEQYFSTPANDLSDGFCESGVKTLMKHVHTVLKAPSDYEARANIFLACTYGCNGIYSLGIAYSGWPLHAIEHALSAYYDITHGIGLAIITPRWMQKVLNENTVGRFVKFGVNVVGIDPSLAPMEIARQTIDRLYAFYESIGIPMHLREVGIDESRVREMAQHVNEFDNLERAWAPLNEDDIAEIIEKSL